MGSNNKDTVQLSKLAFYSKDYKNKIPINLYQVAQFYRNPLYFDNIKEFS